MPTRKERELALEATIKRLEEKIDKLSSFLMPKKQEEDQDEG